MMLKLLNRSEANELPSGIYYYAHNHTTSAAGLWRLICHLGGELHVE